MQAKPSPLSLEESYRITTPGSVIGTTLSHTPGDGCYVNGMDIVSALVGAYKISTSPISVKPIICVESVPQRVCLVPKEHDIVMAQVIRINRRSVYVSIISIQDQILSQYFSGSIRISDICASKIDNVEVYKCFRPGDLIRAEVISLGDAKTYYLSTAKNELGVFFAKSMAGHAMIPISWDMMQCSKTKIKEYRKVAKAISTPHQKDTVKTS